MPEMNENWRPYHGGWRCRGFRRMTVPRQIILDKLRTAQEPLAAEDLYLAVHQVYPQIGLATVYRTLELLTQEGEVVRLELGDRKARYTLLPAGTVHNSIYLVCTRCGNVQAYPQLKAEDLSLLNNLTAGIAADAHFQLRVVHLQLRGICHQCQNQIDSTIERDVK